MVRLLRDGPSKSHTRYTTCANMQCHAIILPYCPCCLSPVSGNIVKSCDKTRFADRTTASREDACKRCQAPRMPSWPFRVKCARLMPFTCPKEGMRTCNLLKLFLHKVFSGTHVQKKAANKSMCLQVSSTVSMTYWPFNMIQAKMNAYLISWKCQIVLWLLEMTCSIYCNLRSLPCCQKRLYRIEWDGRGRAQIKRFAACRCYWYNTAVRDSAVSMPSPCSFVQAANLAQSGQARGLQQKREVWAKLLFPLCFPVPWKTMSVLCTLVASGV